MKIAVFGAGIAGLTVAHELAELGHEVTVYEQNDDVGGFFRSARMPEDGGMPSEYSWHGFGPWYHNSFELMRKIPVGDKTVFDHNLSRPVNFGIAHTRLKPLGLPQSVDVGDVFDGKRMFGFTWQERLHRAIVLVRAWSTNRRSLEEYSKLEGWKEFPKLSWHSVTTWRSTFGPWIGSDWKNVSFHHVQKFFQQNYFSGPPEQHPADDVGPAWTHGRREGWLLLRAPSSEAWFQPWVDHLRAKRVRIVTGVSLERMNVGSKNEIESAMISTGGTVHAHRFVLAVSPFAAREIIKRSDLTDPELDKFEPLTERGPHVQVSFRLGFKDKIKWPDPKSGTLRGGVVLADSEWNLTLFPQELAWHKDVSLGDGIKSLWTVTACVSSESVLGKTIELSTKEEFLVECIRQLQDCQQLQAILRLANEGKDMRDFSIFRTEVWHEWIFSKDGITAPQPKWVDAIGTEISKPDQKTGFINLVVAGAHTRTTAGIWSVEAAVESGRLAAALIDERVTVKRQYRHPILKMLAAVDDVLYRLKLPHVVDVVEFGLYFLLIAWILSWR